MGTSCAPFLADVFLYSYEAGFMQGLLKKNEKKLARSSNFTFRYIQNKYVVNRKFEYADDNFLVEPEFFFSFYKIRS
jgi:hypothetical protein